MAAYEINKEEMAQLKEEERQATTKARLRNFSILLGMVILARFLIPDPEPPKAPDHSKRPFTAVPGMLQLLPQEEIDRMDPVWIAKMQQADLNALDDGFTSTQDWETEQYSPVKAPLDEMATAQEQYKEEIFRYLRKKQRRDILKKQEQVDRTKKMLVRFDSGGYIKAQKTWPKNGQIRIQINRGLIAGIPRNKIRSITKNALYWKAPIPKGHVQLKPAHGITIVVSNQTAKRISLKKKPRYEI